MLQPYAMQVTTVTSTVMSLSSSQTTHAHTHTHTQSFDYNSLEQQWSTVPIIQSFTLKARQVPGWTSTGSILLTRGLRAYSLECWQLVCVVNTTYISAISLFMTHAWCSAHDVTSQALPLIQSWMGMSFIDELCNISFMLSLALHVGEII